MIDVLLFDGKFNVQDRAEAETVEDAWYAGRVLYDEAVNGNRGQKLSVGFYVDGKLSVRTDGRP